MVTWRGSESPHQRNHSKDMMSKPKGHWAYAMKINLESKIKKKQVYTKKRFNFVQIKKHFIQGKREF